MSDLPARMMFGGMRRSAGGRPGRPGKGGCSGRVFLALIMLAVAFASYYGSTKTELNPYTGEEQRIPKEMTPEMEIAMGLQAVDPMKQQHGGDHPDQGLQQEIDRIGAKLLSTIGKHPYKFEFHLLKDPDTINAFALPGGQVFMTYGLYKMLPSENEVAGVIGHEIGHVIGRHSAEQIAMRMRNAGIGQAAGVLMSDGGQNPAVAGMVNQMLTTRYGRDDEYQADALGVQIMISAGYDPKGLIGVMKVLEQASGGARQPEFMSTHPNPGNRASRIKELIAKYEKPH